MNEEKLIFAIGEIEDGYILSAGNRLNRYYAAEEKRQAKRTDRRAIICIAAVIALMLSTFATAMALNEEFRESVLSIFSIGETERVRHSGAVDIGDVDASYMELDDSYILLNGLICKTRENVLCLLEDGKLRELETKTGSVELEHNGVKQTLRYAYTVLDGQLHTWEISQEHMGEDPLMYLWSLTPLRGSEDKAWLTTLRSRGGDYSAHPILLDVVSGETVDILQSIDLDGVICDAWFFSPDNRYAVIRTDGYDRLVDLISETVTELKGCRESYFLSDGSLVCFIDREAGFDLVRRDLESGSEEVLLDNAHYAGSTEDGSGYLSIDYYGGSGDHALLTDENGSITMLDLTDGSRVLLDGIRKEQGEKLRTLESDDGSRVAVAVKAAGSRSAFRSLGMIDCESGTLRIFERSNTLDTDGEELFGFTADGSLGVIGMSEKGQWLYVYDFGKTESLSK